MARQLLDHGMYISMGIRHNPTAIAVIPRDRLLAETDDDPTANIADIRNALGL
ncbi:MAG TPA: hypothetical protein PLL05_09210 [Muribaculaceae bacterium]|nr:hypothetical protein [Muribaculaceae bacterium]